MPALLCKVFILFICGVFVQTNCEYTYTFHNGDSVCHSRDCVRHANTIMKNMNPEIDPCQDFYSFACGGYKKGLGVNETKSVYDDTWNLLQIQLKDLIENLKPKEGSSSEKLKTVFENCMNNESSEMKAVSDAIDFLNFVEMQNWPRLSEDFTFVKLCRALGKLAAFGEFAFIHFKPSPYNVHGDSNLLPSALMLQGNFLLNSKMNQKDVHTAVTRTLSYFNISENETEQIWKEFTEIENAGIQLQKESGTLLDCGSVQRSTVRAINCSDDASGYLKFICNFWRYAVEAGNLDQYYSSDIIHIPCRNHYHYINNIFSYLGNISHRSLANYLSLRFFISHLDDLNTYFHMTKRTYPGDKRSRTSKPIKRWEYCVGWIIKTMNPALGYEYTKTILTETIQKSVLDIINDYIAELHNSITNLSWLSERIKLYLKKQLVNLDIGFRKTVNNYRNKTLVESLYRMFNPTKGSFLKNILEYQKMSLIMKEKSQFNSFYSASDPYTMDFGMSLLQPPTFTNGLPKIWNYAALGCVIGHELSHNFKFFFDFVHLDEASEKSLECRMRCFIEMYSEFIVKKIGKMTSWSETKEEVIADNLGWALTEKIIDGMMIDESYNLLKLPGLNYTSLQLVYISYAQDSCAVMSKDVETEFYATKPQNLAYLRINAVLQNSKTFSDTFHCGKRDAMNPENKCAFFD